MAGTYGSKLIWQRCAPAPFESAWSIFVKLLALNGRNPQWIASLIAKDDFPIPSEYPLNFRDSSWIDFERFSELLGVDQSRLRLAFLDQIGVEVKQHNDIENREIKVCKACLAKGYHSVLFELGFVDTCPWHMQKLETSCHGCYMTVARHGLSKVKNNGDRTASDNEVEYSKFQSACRHILFSECNVGSFNQLSADEEHVITSHSIDLLKWWRAVEQNPAIAEYLLNVSLNDGDRESIHLNSFVSAAENIAGPCPWPIGNERPSIRALKWEQHGNEEGYDHDRAPRKSEWDVVYRSVRRHLFNRYVRKHRNCWNELINYNRTETHKLDSDAVCPVALAFAAWRLSIELFISIEVLKTNRFRDKPIKVLGLISPEFINTPAAFSNLLYAYFFQIWDEVLQYAGKESFAISTASIGWYERYVATMFNPALGASEDDRPAGEWSLIFPDFKCLEKQSFIACCGRDKNIPWLTSSWFWGDGYWGLGEDSLFKIKKIDPQFPTRRARYTYINL